MTDRKPWPSRRLQITVAILLAVGAGIAAFAPPIGREKQAQKLYEDAWFKGGFSSDSDPKAAVQLLKRALKLSPGNSLYEQALVWFTPSKDLLTLEKKAGLDPRAKRLAYGIYTTGAGRWGDQTRRYDKEPKLRNALQLAKLDSGNSIAHYIAAGALAKSDRPDEALSQVKLGNRIGSGRFYLPETTERVFDSIVSPGMHSSGYLIGSSVRSAGRSIVALGSSRLRAGDVSGACDAFEACCKMGVIYTISKPGSMTDFLTGRAIFAVGWASLKPVCKDFGFGDKLDRYRKIDAAFDAGQKDNRRFVSAIMEDAMSAASATYAFPSIATVGAGISALAALVAFLTWAAIRLAVQAKGQERYHISPWGEGWPVRLFLGVYIPVLSLTGIGIAFLLRHPSAMALMTFGTAIVSILGIGQFLVLGVMGRKLERSFRDATGQPKIWFRIPANRQEWSARWMIAGLGIQAAFFICIGFLVIMLFKPIFGVQIWQPERISYHIPSIERAMSRKIAAELRNASPAEWKLGR